MMVYVCGIKFCDVCSPSRIMQVLNLLAVLVVLCQPAFAKKGDQPETCEGAPQSLALTGGARARRVSARCAMCAAHPIARRTLMPLMTSLAHCTRHQIL